MKTVCPFLVDSATLREIGEQRSREMLFLIGMSASIVVVVLCLESRVVLLLLLLQSVV